jgi:DNA polymerase-3 subunit delta'
MKKYQYLLEKFKKIIQNNKLTHLYLFESQNNNITMSFVLDLVYEFLKDDTLTYNLQYLIKNFSYPNFYYLDSKKDSIITKEQVSEMQKYFHQTSLLQKKKVFIINKTENLSYKAANSLLYFLENPINDNILGILLTQNHNLLLSTIISRSQFFNLDFFFNLENKKNNFLFEEKKKKLQKNDNLNNLINPIFLEKNRKKQKYNLNFKKFFLIFLNNFNKYDASFINLYWEARFLLTEKKFINDFLFFLINFFLNLYNPKFQKNNFFSEKTLNKYFFNKLSKKQINVFLNIFIQIEQKNYFLDNQLCFLTLLIMIEKKQKEFFYF